MREDRVVNIRFLFCVFIGLMLGIIANYLFLIKKINLFVLILFIILSVIVCCVCWVYAIKTQNFNKQFKARKNVSFLVKCSGLGFVIAFIVGLIIMINPMQNILGIREYTNEVVVNGVICDYIDNESTYTKFLIKDCFIARFCSSL
jgi:hypothetical protein